MPFATFNGARHHYLQLPCELNGEGAPDKVEDLVMVHGLATSMAFWYIPYAARFAKRFRVTLYDLRGMGGSEVTPTGYRPQQLAADLKGLMDHLSIPTAHVVAHSYGGVVALNLACQDASRVRSLVLADTHISAARHRPHGREWANRAHVQGVLDRNGIALDTHDPYFGYHLLTEVAHLQISKAPMSDELKRLIGPIMARQGRRTATQWVRLMDETAAPAELMGDDGLHLDRLRRLLFPILALYGDHSQALLTGGELLDIWPHAEFRRVRDAGHFFPTSRPDDVIEECEKFWRGDYARKPVMRSGEPTRRHFRSERVFKSGGQWHYSTREKERIGPFATIDEAHDALARYVSGLPMAA